MVSARLSIPKVLKPEEEKTAVRTYLLQATLTPGDALVEVSLQHIKHDNSFKVRVVAEGMMFTTGRGVGSGHCGW